MTQLHEPSCLNEEAGGIASGRHPPWHILASICSCLGASLLWSRLTSAVVDQCVVDRYDGQRRAPVTTSCQ